MKIKIIIFLLCIIPIFLIYKITYVDKIDYLALGDGLALGWTHYGTIGYGYTDYVKECLQKNNKLKSYNKTYAEKQLKVTELIGKIELNEETVHDGKKIHIQKSITDAEIITISIGNNEISNVLKYTQNSKESYIQMNETINQINYLLELIRQYNDKQIIFIGFYSYGLENNEKLIEYINENLEIISKKNDVIYINIDDIISQNIKYLPNTIENYPSNSGYERIAQEVIKKIKL